MPAEEAATLSRLRRAVAEIEGSDLFALETGERVLPLGAEAIDAALGGGLAFGSLHELAPAGPLHFGAAAGFALTLAASGDKRRHSLWIQPDFAGQEAGTLYGPGLTALGFPMQRLLLLRVARPVDVLWAMEEALKSRVLASVIAELTDKGAAADLTATRRRHAGISPRLRAEPTPSAVWVAPLSPSRL
jgi:protein ImuA